MPRKRATAKQVAERAGVSQTTVSFVMNDVSGMNISEETRVRVRDAARALDYVPLAAARTLASGKTETIGLVIGRRELLKFDAFVPQLLYGLDEVARERGYHLLVEGIDAIGSDDPYAQLVRSRQIDGLIVLDPLRTDASLQRLILDGFPVVTMGDVPGLDPYRVVSDNVDAMRRATLHLVRLGHERIAHLTFSPTGFVGTDERLEGYRSALEKSGLTFDPNLVVEVGYSAASGAAAMQSLLERRKPFTALTCGNDTVAMGALATLHRAGFRVPGDVAVVGFDDIPTAAFMTPALTTMRTDPVQGGREAMTMLATIVEGRTPPTRVIATRPPLVVRASCGAVPAWAPSGDAPP